MASYGLAEHLIPTNWRYHQRGGSAFDQGYSEVARLGVAFIVASG